MLRALLLTATAIGGAAEEPTCSCPQLQSQVQRLEQEQHQMLLQVKTQEAQMRAVVERLQVLERLQAFKTTPAPEPVVPKPSGSKPAGLAVSVEALGSVGAAAHGRRQLQSEGRKGRRLSVEGAKCADEGGTCTCDGLIYLGTRYVSGSPGSGAENTFEQMLALPYTPPTGVVDTGAGYVGQGHTFVSMDGLGLGGSAVCSAATLGVADPSDDYYKACWCSPKVQYEGVATRGWQTHSFPAGHSCPNLNNGRPKQLLPVYDGAATWNPSPQNVTNLTLVSVNSDWSLDVVLEMPSPISVVHDDSCEAAHLELGLDVEIPGSLTVGGTEVKVDDTVLYSVREDGLFDTLSGTGFAMTDMPGMTKTFSLNKESKVIIQYAVSWEIYTNQCTTYCLLNTNLYLDGVRIPEATSIGGLGNGATWAGFYGTNTGTYMSTLAAGDHTVKIMYRTDNSIAVNSGNQQATKGIQILVL
jgi:hypothetical protein